MDFHGTINAFAARAEKLKGSITTEEACETALVTPFLNALGHDVFNPDAVAP